MNKNVTEIIKETEPSIFLINHYDNSSSFSNLQDINSVSDDVLQLNNQTSVLLENITMDPSALADAQQAFNESDFEMTSFDDDHNDSEKLNFDQSNSDSLQQAINACTKSIEVMSSSNDDIDNSEVFDDSDYNLDEVFENKSNLVDSIENIIDVSDVGELEHEVNTKKFEITLKSETVTSIKVDNTNVSKVDIKEFSREVKGKICEICNRICRSNGRLKIHMLSHSSDKPHKCMFDGCRKEFKSKIGLTEHEAKHTGDILIFINLFSRFIVLNFLFI